MTWLRDWIRYGSTMKWLRTWRYRRANRLRNLRLAGLIESWLQDDSRDDERLGPLLDGFLAENPISFGEQGTTWKAETDRACPP